VQVKNVDDLVAETSVLRESLESSAVTMEDMRGKCLHNQYVRCEFVLMRSMRSSSLLMRSMICTLGWFESFYSFF
jgi:hypothetical protein